MTVPPMADRRMHIPILAETRNEGHQCRKLQLRIRTKLTSYRTRCFSSRTEVIDYLGLGLGHSEFCTPVVCLSDKKEKENSQIRLKLALVDLLCFCSSDQNRLDFCNTSRLNAVDNFLDSKEKNESGIIQTGKMQ